MRGKTAKALRRIARDLKLPAKTELAPMGPLVRDAADRPKRRPFALKACTRRAYQEAKAIYKGQKQAIVGQAGDLTQETRAFKHRMVDSMRAQPKGPVTQ